MGGTGGGVAYTKAEFIEIVERGIDASPTNEVLIEESVLGWKEYEMEVVRDRRDNCIIICSIENLDPMGVHTGDSITVAPAQTLTDKEYQRMTSDPGPSSPLQGSGYGNAEPGCSSVGSTSRSETLSKSTSRRCFRPFRGMSL